MSVAMVLPFSGTRADIAARSSSFDEPAIAHLDKDGRTHDYMDHAETVASGMRSFFEEFGLGDLAYMTGYLHDAGKLQREWQDGIRQIRREQCRTAAAA